jgi:hypothetical protein
MKQSGYGKQQLSEIVEVPKWSTSQTRRVIKALDDSGMSVTKFCGLHGLNYWRVINAKRRIRGDVSGRVSSDGEPALVPVVIEQPVQVPRVVDGDGQRWVLEVRLGRYAVRVAAEASEQAVQSAIRAVRALGC